MSDCGSGGRVNRLPVGESIPDFEFSVERRYKSAGPFTIIIPPLCFTLGVFVAKW